jgi:hypothetical protein
VDTWNFHHCIETATQEERNGIRRTSLRRTSKEPEGTSSGEAMDLKVKKYGGLSSLVPKMQRKETKLFDLAKVDSHLPVQEVGE